MEVKPSLPHSTHTRTPREQAEDAVQFWIMVLLVVIISFILLSRYILHRRDSNSEDDEWPSSPIDVENGRRNPQFFVGQYRDDGDGPDDSAFSTPNELNNLQSSPNDSPYEAGVRVISSVNSPSRNGPHPHPTYNYNHQTLSPGGLTNIKEIRRLIAQLNRIKDGPDPESEDNSARIMVIQHRVTELVMADPTDPRYSFNVPSSSLLVDPPPAYSDVIVEE